MLVIQNFKPTCLPPIVFFSMTITVVGVFEHHYRFYLILRLE